MKTPEQYRDIEVEKCFAALIVLLRDFGAEVDPAAVEAFKASLRDLYDSGRMASDRPMASVLANLNHIIEHNGFAKRR